jgi:hypothetical protein
LPPGRNTGKITRIAINDHTHVTPVTESDKSEMSADPQVGINAAVYDHDLVLVHDFIPDGLVMRLAGKAFVVDTKLTSTSRKA